MGTSSTAETQAIITMKVLIIFALVAVAAATVYPVPARTYFSPKDDGKEESPAPVEATDPAPVEAVDPAPVETVYPTKAYVAPVYQPPTYEYVAHPYAFQWTVEDVPSYNSFGHQVTSDGKTVTGSYRVVLPDGRTQTVTYTVDGYSGYVADVVYEGVAKYPEYSAPAYKAAAYPAKY